MTTISAIFNAFAPAYLERFPNLPRSHRKTLTAIRDCRSGHYGHSFYQCQRCGERHRIPHRHFLLPQTRKRSAVTTNLNVLEFIRRFLQHVLPDGLMKVRPFGFMHASGSVMSDTIRMMILRQHHIVCVPTHVAAPPPCVASCPTCGGQMRVVMRRWTAHRAFLDTG